MNIIVNTILAIYILGTILGLYLVAVAIVGLMQDGQKNEY